jgi:hypothetical protein
MAKKQNNQSKNGNILSSRMQKTNHTNNQGRYGQQAEINIFVEDTNTTPQQFPIDKPTTDIKSNNKGSLLQSKMNKEKYQATDHNVSQNIEFTVSDTDNNIPISISDTITSSSNDPHNPLYSNMYKKEKKNKFPKIKKQDFSDLETLDGKNGNPFKNEIPRKTKLIIVFSIILAITLIVQIVFRVPAIINENPKKQQLLLETNTEKLNNYMKVENGTEDWDGDGILNAQDTAIFNPDVDKNGLADSLPKEEFITKEEIITYENITIQPKNQKCGCSKFLTYYCFENYNGWAKIENETGIPYKHTNNGWQKATYNKEGSIYYVKISGDCLIEFVPEGTETVYITNILKENIFSSKESRYVNNYGFFAPVYANLLKAIFPVREANSKTICTVAYSDTYHIIKYKNINKSIATVPNSSNYVLSTLNNYECSYDKLYKVY